MPNSVEIDLSVSEFLGSQAVEESIAFNFEKKDVNRVEVYIESLRTRFCLSSPKCTHCNSIM